MRKTIFYIMPGIIIAACLVAFLSLRSPEYGAEYGEVKGKVVDELSEDAVWGVKIFLDGKSATRYMSKTYHLTEIKPGSYTLEATAPNYCELRKQIQVERGTNIVNIPMKGKEYGILEVTLHSPQGDFKHSGDRVRLFQSSDTF